MKAKPALLLAVGDSLATLVRAVPMGETQESEQTWRPEPKGRGTMGILVPCLTTLSLCVWTAIHLNVNPQQTRLRGLAFKLLWLFLGIFAPEYVLYCAFIQFMEARAVRYQMHHLRKRRWKVLQTQAGAHRNGSNLGAEEDTLITNRETVSAVKRCWRRLIRSLLGSKSEEELFIESFGMASAFFVVMGGYTIHPGPGVSAGLPLTVTPYGFLVLYAKGEITEDELDTRHIEDKSKANALAKLLVCFQASVRVPFFTKENNADFLPTKWLVIQGIGRLTSELPVPLLEVHTVAHVVSALSMYGFWWHKPQDVGFPMILNLTTLGLAKELYASFKIHPLASWEAPNSIHERVEMSSPHVLRDGTAVHTPLPSKLKGNSFAARWKRYWNSGEIGWFDQFGPPGLYTHWHRTFRIQEPNAAPMAPETTETVTSYFSEPPTDFVASIGHKKKPLRTRARMSGTQGFITDGTYLVGRFDLLYLLWFLPVVNGVVHAVAWNTQFPTAPERFLWRFSSLSVATIGPWAICLTTLSNLHNRLGGSYRGAAAVSNLFNSLMILNIFFGSLLFILARCFLVFESFLSLRSLPKGSFETVSWGNYWPHFS
jgi:hypothetical protein